MNWRCFSSVHCQFQWWIQDFPEEGALTLKGGCQPIIWPIFPKNCMKMKKFWARRGARFPHTPLRSATEFTYEQFSLRKPLVHELVVSIIKFVNLGPNCHLCCVVPGSWSETLVLKAKLTCRGLLG